MTVILLTVVVFLAGIAFERRDQRQRAQQQEHALDRARQADLWRKLREQETSATPLLWRHAPGRRELPREAADAERWAALRDEMARTTPVPTGDTP